MKFNIKSMPDCCWKYLDGINNKHIYKRDFQVLLLKSFRNTNVLAKNWRAAQKTTGAIMFCGSFGGGAMTMYGDCVDKGIVTKNVEEICTWIEEEGIGDIVELPQFYNGLHKSQILPRMWIIDQEKLKRVMRKWYRNPVIKAKYLNEVNGVIW